MCYKTKIIMYKQQCSFFLLLMTYFMIIQVIVCLFSFNQLYGMGEQEVTQEEFEAAVKIIRSKLRQKIVTYDAEKIKNMVGMCLIYGHHVPPVENNLYNNTTPSCYHVSANLSNEERVKIALTTIENLKQEEQICKECLLSIEATLKKSLETEI